MKFAARLGVLPYLLLGTGLFIVGLMTIGYIVDNWWPFNVARLDLVRATALDRIDSASLLEAANSEILLAFLAAVVVGVTGVALPLAYILNERFSHFSKRQLELTGPPRFLVILRQAIAVGLWASFCVWLQMNRALGLAVALLVAAVLILFEVLLQIRTRATRVTGAQSTASSHQ
jgi:ABC-type xylose transport system permease subunit